MIEMSILDRNVKKGNNTAFKKGLKLTGDLGIWTEYFKGIPFSSCGIEEVRFHLIEKEEMRSLIEKEFEKSTVKEEGYLTLIGEKRADVYALCPIGLIYAVENIKSHIQNGKIFCGAVYNYPDKDFRALKAFLPARENIAYFYELIDYCLAYGLNAVVLEVGGAMEYITHPEINEGWLDYCKKFKAYPGQSVEYQFSMDIPKNSIHWENGGGGVLTQNEVRTLVAYCKERGMQVIPEQPTLSHCDYMLYNHNEFAERKEDPTPDAYCPKNEGVLQLSVELLEEIIQVFKPDIVHIGHDELYTVGICERCGKEDPAKLFADDVNFYNRFLKKKNIKTMIWSDKLLNAKGKAGHEWGGSEQNSKREDGTIKYHVPATYRCFEVIDPDVLIMHWYWMIDRNFDEYLLKKFKVCYGNFKGVEMLDADRRLKLNTYGFCVSNWAECKDELLQRNGVLFHIAYNSMMTWSGSFSADDYCNNILKVSSDMFRYNNSKSNASAYVLFTHNTDTFKFHEEFVDGFFPVKAEDFVGKYELIFEGGKKIEVPVYYGYNVGYSKNKLNAEISEMYDGYMFDKQLFETTFRCEYLVNGKEMFYRYKVPLDAREKLLSWKFISNGKFKVNVKSVEVIEAD